MLKPSLLIILTLAAAVNSISLEGNSKLTRRPNHKSVRVPEFVEIDGVEYFLYYDEYVLWQEAVEICTEEGMLLLSLQTKEKAASIMNWLSEEMDYFVWTSGFRAANQTEWVWASTGEPFTNTEWNGIQPDFAKDQNACMNVASALYPGWDDDPCDHKDYKFALMCEWPDTKKQ